MHPLMTARALKPLLLLIGLAALGGSVPAAKAASASASASPWRETVQKFAAEHFRHPAWGYSHAVRDYRLARSLATADHVTLDDDVLYAAAYLHDMAAFAPWEKPGEDHADVAAGIVDSVLRGTGFPMEKIDAVRAAIRTHMYDRDLSRKCRAASSHPPGEPACRSLRASSLSS